MIKTSLRIFALLAPMAAFAQSSLHTISTVPAQPRPGEAFQIKVTGSWPNACPLQLLPVAVAGGNIDVAVRQGDVICGDAITPYTVSFNTASAGPAGFPLDRDYRIRFSVRDAAGNPTLLAFRVADVARPEARAAAPEAGFWAPDAAGEFPASSMGSGFMLERQGGTLALTINGYQLNGQATWFLSAGSFSGSVFHGDLLRSIGGQPIWGTYHGPQSVAPGGTLDIEFINDSQAVMWFAKVADEGVLAPLELTPISARRMNFALASGGRALGGSWALTPVSRLTAPTSALIRLTFADDRSTPSEAVLVDAQQGYELRCSLDSLRSDGPPRLCILTSGGAEIARFDNNALARLSGKRGNDAVSMVRVSD